MAEISMRLLTVRERLERSRRELVLMPDVFSATAELGAAIAEISRVAELLERETIRPVERLAALTF